MATKSSGKKPAAKKAAVKKKRAVKKSVPKKAAKKTGASSGAEAVAAYLEAQPKAARAALLKLRTMIYATAPDATEKVSYGVVVFVHHGMLVAMGAKGERCSFYLMSATILGEHRADVAGYDCAKGTIHFTPNAPLPAALVKKLVQARMRYNEARR